MSKTTIRNIDPNTFWDAKIYAAQTQQTIGQVVTEALQHLFQEDETIQEGVIPLASTWDTSDPRNLRN